jgi:lysine 6-dehydrogenase
MRYLVIGAGRCGQAIAYDLAKNGGAEKVMLFDQSMLTVCKAAERLRDLCPDVRFPLTTGEPLYDQFDCVVSSAPYKFNAGFAQRAITAKTNFVDLGGNTSEVERVLRYDEIAKKNGVTVIPDCGMAPGLVNIIAAIGVKQVDGAQNVKIVCGGLPVNPKGLFKYSMLFNVDGLINEYSGKAEVLRNWKLKKIPTLSELEIFQGFRNMDMGPFECFVTSGGSSLAPRYFKDRLKNYEYKTARYIGHNAMLLPLKKCGFFSEEEEHFDDDSTVSPRQMLARVLEKQFYPFDGRDFMIAQVEITDKLGYGLRYQLLDWHNVETGFSAMERTTAFPTALIALMAAKGALPRGVMTPEAAGFDTRFFEALDRRGIEIRAENICEGSP